VVALSGLASEVGHVVRMGCAYTHDKRTIRAVAPIENAMATTSRTEIMMKLAVRVTLVEDRLAHITSDSGDSSVMTLSGSATVSLRCCDERIVHFYAHKDSLVHVSIHL